MKAVNPKLTAEYVPECDRDLHVTEQTRFELTRLTAAEDALIKDLGPNFGEVQLTALHLGLANVRNLTLDGDAVVLQRDSNRAFLIGKKRPWTDECLSKIPREVRDEVAGAILRAKAFAEAETKNS